jgi:hypothetical protein
MLEGHLPSSHAPPPPQVTRVSEVLFQTEDLGKEIMHEAYVTDSELMINSKLCIEKQIL